MGAPARAFFAPACHAPAPPRHTFKSTMSLRAQFLACVAAGGDGASLPSPARMVSDSAGSLSPAPLRAQASGAGGLAGTSSRVGGRSSAALQTPLLAMLSSSDAVDALTRSDAWLHASSRFIAAHTLQPQNVSSFTSSSVIPAASASRVTPSATLRQSKLSSALFAVTTHFNALPYGLPLQAGDRRKGGVLLAFDFYSSLFSPDRQAGVRLASMSLAAQARANATMSVGELTYMLRDFGVVPQLLSRGELRYILGVRTMGETLRRRRETMETLRDMLQREEEALRQEQYARKIVYTGTSATAAAPHATATAQAAKRVAGAPTAHASAGHAASAASPGVDSSLGTEAVERRLDARKEKIRRLRHVLAEINSPTAGMAAGEETRMEHATSELSYTEFLEVLVRIALFVFSKPGLAQSDVGAAGEAAAQLTAAAASFRRDAGRRASLAEAGGSGLPKSAIHSMLWMLDPAASSLSLPDMEVVDMPERKVLRLLHYMQLDDVAATKRRLQTVGTVTQQALSSPYAPTLTAGDSELASVRGIPRPAYEEGKWMTGPASPRLPDKNAPVPIAASPGDTSSFAARKREKYEGADPVVVDSKGKRISTLYVIPKLPAAIAAGTSHQDVDSNGAHVTLSAAAAAAVGSTAPPSDRQATTRAAASAMADDGTLMSAVTPPETALVSQYSDQLLYIVRSFETDAA
ncbi:hypothetical protein EON68_00345, partial [archaeon]